LEGAQGPFHTTEVFEFYSNFTNGFAQPCFAGTIQVEMSFLPERRF
jgi:hypothetical protein